MNTAKSKNLLNGALVCLLAASAPAGVLTSPAYAAAPAKDSAPSAAPATQIDAKSSQIMKGVGTFYKDMKGFTQTMSTEMKISAADKQTAMTSVFKVSFGRPNKFYLKLESGKMGGQMICDGKTAYLYTPVLNKYMSMPAPENLSQIFDTIDYQIVGGGFSSMSLIESMCTPDPYKQIMADVLKVEHIGVEKVGDNDCDHMRFTQKDFTWDMWVRQGKEPWIQKVTADMSKILANKPGAPEGVTAVLTCSYTDSQANVEPTAQLLTFAKPEGAQEVKSFLEEKSAQPASVHPLVNKPAPSFDLETVDGAKFNLAAQKGKVVVLDFWATWCGPCTMALPIITEVTSSLKDKDVVFLAVNIQETPAQIKEFLEKKNLKVSVGLDSEGKVAEMYQVRGIPQTVIVGKDGNVAEVHIGFSPDLKESFTKELNDILKK
jgi:peroxiredoxin